MKILVVDDDKEIRQFLKRSLSSHCYQVDLAKNGKEGLELALYYDYDLLILDNKMPIKDGIQVCRELREEGLMVPIIILSVLSEPITKAELLNIGADDYLTKPFLLEELLARISAILRRPKKIEKKVLQLDDLVLDIDKQKVTRGEKNIELTLKEFMLLECLIKNIGSVMSRSLLLEQIWETTCNPLSNTVDAHIYNLRKKIDHKGVKKLIHTVSGRGYKMDLET